MDSYGDESKEIRALALGSWLPFFYNDKKRTFFVLPSITLGSRERERGAAGGIQRYYIPK